MNEIHPNLFVGREQDFEAKVRVQHEWNVVHACKEPYHRGLLGYKGRGAPKDHPEYFFAVRSNRLFLNLVDADDLAYIPAVIIDRALRFIHESLNAERKVLVHCNHGESRAPSIGFMYLLAHTDRIQTVDFLEAEKVFLGIYPTYRPANGIRQYARNFFLKLKDQ